MERGGNYNKMFEQDYVMRLINDMISRYGVDGITDMFM